MRITAWTVALAGVAAGSPALGQTAFSWTIPTDGLWSDTTRWTPAGSPGAAASLDSATLGLVGAYTVTLDASRTVATLNIPNPDARLVIESSSSLTLGAGFQGLGEVVVNDQSSAAASLVTLLDGAGLGGLLTLNASAGVTARAVILGPFAGGESATIQADATVRGTGRLRGYLHNRGVIKAEGTGAVIEVGTSAALTSDGSLHTLNGGTLRINAGLDGGSLTGDASSRVSAGGSGVGNATLVGVLVVPPSSSLVLAPGNTYTGEIVVNDQSTPGASLVTLLDGAGLGGIVTLNPTDGVVFRAEILGPFAGGESATIQPDATVRGTGRLRGFFNEVLGAIAPGTDSSSGVIELSASGPVILAGSAVAEFRLGGEQDDQFARIVNNGVFDLGGLCRVTLADGYVPQLSDRWDIIEGGTINGQFAAYDLPPAPAEMTYRVFFEPGLVFVRLVCGPDFNGDLIINFFDVSGFLSAYNAQLPVADLAAPQGVFNFFDVAAFLQIYQAGCP